MDACANHAGHQSFRPVRNSHSQDVQLRMKNSRRRVVITGLGVVAPNGIGKEAFWANLVAGKSAVDYRSEEHTSELQSQSNLVCRLLLEKKKNHLCIAGTKSARKQIS